MTWDLSCFRAGDVVEVLSKEEILSTLDEQGCTDGMPFMPEMLQYCGKQYCVRAVAHKSCETANKTWTGRRLQKTVHLDNLRCDGSSHGGCEAACTLFWNDKWLKPAGTSTDLTDSQHHTLSKMTEALLLEKTQLPKDEDKETQYSCQATKLDDASKTLKWWDLRQYLFDVMTKNHSAGYVFKVVFLASLRTCVSIVQRGYHFSDRMHYRLTGQPAPYLSAKIKAGEKTPAGRLNLKAGELIRIKSQSDIEETINDQGLNRGLSFDCREMAPYCGQVFRVKRVVTKIIDESTGKMIYMKEPCIMLEGVVCNSKYSSCRLNCPRAIPCYWREIWLEREPEVSI